MLIIIINYITNINFSSGLDSLMGVEVSQTLERDFDIQMSMKDVRLLTVDKMRELTQGNGQRSRKRKEGI